MQVAIVISWLKRAIIATIVATSLTACFVEPMRCRPGYAEPVAARVVIHGRY